MSDASTAAGGTRTGRWQTTALLWAVPVALRLGLLAWESLRGQAVLSYVYFSDASSFLGVARAILDPARVAELTYYDTRVFPLWPAVEAVLLALRASDVVLLGLPIALSGAVSWLLHRATGNLPAALLLGCAPPVWLISTVHPMSEAFYLTLGVAAACAFGGRRFAFAGVLAGLMVATRPFGIAWVAAGALLLVAGARSGRGRAEFLRYSGGVALGVIPLIGLNLHLYGDVLHQLRVYNTDLATLNLGAEAAQSLGGATGHWGPPFWHVLTTPWRVEVPLWKTVYIYAHVAALLALVPSALRQLRTGTAAERFLLLAFLVNGALIVCTGPYWGFHSFDRYFLWGLPGALVAFATVVRPAAWSGVLAAGATASLAAAVFALQRLHP